MGVATLNPSYGLNPAAAAIQRKTGNGEKSCSRTKMTNTAAVYAAAARRIRWPSGR